MANRMDETPMGQEREIGDTDLGQETRAGQGAMVYETPQSARSGETPGTGVRKETYRAQDINGRAVITIDSGEKLGNISNLLFDPQSMRVAALLFSSGGLFSRAEAAVPAGEVEVWGKDVILVRSGKTLHAEQLDQHADWVNLSEEINGRYAVSIDGRRVGQVDDVVIDTDGRIVAFALSQVFIDGELAESKRLPVAATHSLGKDVLIVDLSKTMA